MNSKMNDRPSPITILDNHAWDDYAWYVWQNLHDANSFLVTGTTLKTESPKPVDGYLLIAGPFDHEYQALNYADKLTGDAK